MNLDSCAVPLAAGDRRHSPPVNPQIAFATSGATNTIPSFITATARCARRGS